MNLLKNACCLLLITILSYTVQAQIPCNGGSASGYPCSNIDLMSFTPLSAMGASMANDIWGWTSPSTGSEYVLLGLSDATAFFNIDNPVNPVYLGELPTQTSSSQWRDIKVHNNHAFIVSEAGGHGMQVFNLLQLDGQTTSQTWSNTAYYNDAGNGSTFGNAHNIVINEGSGYAYVVGSARCSGGLLAVDISNPTNPTFAGCFSSDGYTHDAQCVDYIGPDPQYQGTEICFNSNENTLTIVDVTDKTDMTQISRTSYSGVRYTHQGWATEDHQYYLMNDELDESNNGTNTRTYIWDIRDLDNPTYLGYHQAPFGSIDHNLYVKGNLAYMSNYQSGLRVIDISNIANASTPEVAYFDTYPANNNTGFNGTWSNYPYFGSGVIAVSGINEGLFLLKITNAACSDGIQNNGETGIDCGGPECLPCPTCDDGIKNGNETAIDCGGPDCPACPAESCPTYDFTGAVVSYDANDNDQGTATVQDGGATVFMTGNAWKAVPINYTLTPNTVIEFDFRSTTQGEIHEVAFDNDLTFAPNARMVVYGTQGFAGDFANPIYTGGGAWQTLAYNIGNVFTGTFQYLVLTADDDATGNGNSYYRNFKIYEDFDNDLVCDNAPACAGVDLDISFDGFPAQTSWDITDANGNVVASGDGNGQLGNGNTIETSCLPDGCYTLNFYDSVNNGMCPFQSTASSSGTFITPGTLITPGSVVATLGSVITPGLCGNYTLTDANGTTLASGGGGFGGQQTRNFCLSGGIGQLVQEEEGMYSRLSSGIISGMSIQPNIVHDELTVLYELDATAEAELYIVDINGKILQQRTQGEYDLQQVRFDVSELPAGFYFVQLVSAESMMARKFVKQ